MLGAPWYENDAAGLRVNHNPPRTAELTLLDLPRFIAAEGFRLLEICNFHLPDISASYLAELRAAIEGAGLRLATLLVDTGNLSAPDDVEWRAHIADAKHWQQVAVALGAQSLRFDCGTEAPSTAALRRSSQALEELAVAGASLGLHTTTENWRQTSVQSADLLRVLDAVEQPLELCVDFGNAAKTGDKYGTMQALLPRASSLHCKGVFEHNELDLPELRHSLSLVKAANFNGHITLISDDTEQEWDQVITLKKHVERELRGA